MMEYKLCKLLRALTTPASENFVRIKHFPPSRSQIWSPFTHFNAFSWQDLYLSPFEIEYGQQHNDKTNWAKVSPVRYAKFLSIQYFIDINIFQNLLIDIDIFQNLLIDIDIDIDIF